MSILNFRWDELPYFSSQWLLDHYILVHSICIYNLVLSLCHFAAIRVNLMTILIVPLTSKSVIWSFVPICAIQDRFNVKYLCHVRDI